MGRFTALGMALGEAAGTAVGRVVGTAVLAAVCTALGMLARVRTRSYTQEDSVDQP